MPSSGDEDDDGGAVVEVLDGRRVGRGHQLLCRMKAGTEKWMKGSELNEGNPELYADYKQRHPELFKADSDDEGGGGDDEGGGGGGDESDRPLSVDLSEDELKRRCNYAGITDGRKLRSGPSSSPAPESEENEAGEVSAAQAVGSGATAQQHG